MSWMQFVRYSRNTEFLGRVPGWPFEQIERLQQQRLGQLVEFAKLRSPFYREKYEAVDPGSFELADLPVTTKDEIRAHWQAALTDPTIQLQDVEQFLLDEANLGQWFQGRYLVSHTSGSQGPPLTLIQDRRSIELMFSVMSARASITRQPGLLEGMRRLAAPKRVAIVTFQRGFYPSGAALEFMQQIVGPYVRVARFSSMQSDLLERLDEFRPHVLVGYASVLEAIAAQAYQVRFAELEQISNSSEQLTSAGRRRIEKAFGVPVFDHYGLGECLHLSDGCPAGAIHVNADWAILEVVDEQYQPVPPGTIGAKVLVTNLANRVQPIIRYEVGDRVALSAERCPCGSRLPRIESIQGRAAELFWINDRGRDRFLSGVLFHAAVDALRDIREWQAVQVERNRVHLLVSLLPGAWMRPEKVERLLLESLWRQGLPASVIVRVRVVPSILHDPTTGKLRRMISQVPPARLLAPTM